MATKIGINGFGRIGRCVLRALHQRGGEGLEVAAINDLTDTAMLGHLLQYDTVHRTFDAKVEVGDGFLALGNQKIKTMAEMTKVSGVKFVLEFDGKGFTGPLLDREPTDAELAKKRKAASQPARPKAGK